MTVHRGTTAVAGILGAIMVLAAACSSSGSGGSPESSGSGGAGGDAPYVIGFSASLTGADAAYGQSGLTGLDAYFSYVGKINGHPVKVVALDDQADTPTAVNNFTSLVDTSHALLVVGEEVSSTGDVIVQRADAAQVPFIALSADSNIVKQPYGFAAGLTLPMSPYYEFAYIKSIVKPAQSVRLAAIASASSAGNDMLTVIKQLAKTAGYSVVSTQTTALPPPSTMSPEAQQTVTTKANFMVGGVEDAGSLDVLYAQALETLGWQGTIANFYGGNSVSTFQTINQPWYTALSPNGYPTETSIPGIATFDTAVKRAGGNPGAIYSPLGWTIGAVVAAGLKKCGYPCSGPKLKSALESEGNIGTLNGFLAGPLELSASNHEAVHYARMYQYKNGQVVPVSAAAYAPTA
jgi:ABC-type branched-subunit amino acid transport system substrate-binding protein